MLQEQAEYLFRKAHANAFIAHTGKYETQYFSMFVKRHIVDDLMEKCRNKNVVARFVEFCIIDGKDAARVDICLHLPIYQTIKGRGIKWLKD